MKKFKKSAEVLQLQDPYLETLLSERGLLRTVFRHYIHLPLGLVISSLMLLSSRLAGRPWLAEENLIFAFQGVAATALFFSFQAWAAFQNHHLKLRQSLNHFVGEGRWPLLFGALFLYLCLPLGWPALVNGLVVVGLTALYAAGRNPLLQRGGLRYQTLTLLILALCWLPLLAPAGTPTPEAAIFLGVCLLIFGVLNQLRHQMLQVGRTPDRR
jgi:hypothetical protein